MRRERLSNDARDARVRVVAVGGALRHGGSLLGLHDEAHAGHWLIVHEKLNDADPLTRLHLTQERLNLHNELEAMKAKTNLTELEEGFISAAKSYGQRKGITHAAWRSLGVPPDVLRKAGISRGD